MVWYEVVGVDGVGGFFFEFGWWEFVWYMFFYFFDLVMKNFCLEFDVFFWLLFDFVYFDVWQYGEMGVLFVDVGMCEFWYIGYMYNWVWMVIVFFFIKNLFIDWRFGEEWFWDMFVDVDEVNNFFNWQWVVGLGVDVVFYFCVFNFELQVKKFDLQNFYVLCWVGDVLIEFIVDLVVMCKVVFVVYDEVKCVFCLFVCG